MTPEGVVIQPEAGSVVPSCELSRIPGCCWRIIFLFPLSLRLNNGALVGIDWTGHEPVVFGAGPAATAAAIGTERTDQRCVRTGEVDRERR